MVFLANGARKPWILRKTRLEDEYERIIDCQVPAFMSGEAMEAFATGNSEMRWVTFV